MGDTSLFKFFLFFPLFPLFLFLFLLLFFLFFLFFFFFLLLLLFFSFFSPPSPLSTNRISIVNASRKRAASLARGQTATGHLEEVVVQIRPLCHEHAIEEREVRR